MSTNGEVIEIYTDGAASPNPGPGGYGVIVVRDGQRFELSGGFRKTTNNRMELLGAIAGLKALGEGGLAVTICSDSRYVVDMVEGGYANRWRQNGWMRDRRHRAENTDLWGELLDLCARRRVTFKWVRGHSEHPENERCDELAVEARQKADLPADEWYERAAAATPEQTAFAWT